MALRRKIEGFISARVFFIFASCGERDLLHVISSVEVGEDGDESGDPRSPGALVLRSGDRVRGNAEQNDGAEEETWGANPDIEASVPVLFGERVDVAVLGGDEQAIVDATGQATDEKRDKVGDGTKRVNDGKGRNEASEEQVVNIVVDFEIGKGNHVIGVDGNNHMQRHKRVVAETGAERVLQHREHVTKRIDNNNRIRNGVQCEPARLGLPRKNHVEKEQHYARC